MTDTRDRRGRPQQGRYRKLNPAGVLFRSAQARAKRNGLPFTITRNDVQIPFLCPVLGVPLARGTRQNKDWAPSLDRVDNRKGYVPGNVRVISWRANHLKSDGSLEELKAVVRYLETTA